MTGKNVCPFVWLFAYFVAEDMYYLQHELYPWVGLTKPELDTL